jgi:hypothetical protein
MSALLYGIGAFVTVLGAVLIGFGIPINEFSFGNTLILAGTMGVIGGMIVISLGVVVAQLRRLAEVLPARAQARPSRPLEMFEPAGISRPPKPTFEPHAAKPIEPESYADMTEGHVSPTLRNPYAPVDDEVSLSPQHPISVPAAVDTDVELEKADGRQEIRQEPALNAGWPPAAPQQTRQPQTAYFDAMWPAETKPVKNPIEKSQLDIDTKPYVPSFDPPPRDSVAEPARRAESEAAMPRQGNEARTVAILKSGVVDGMGYTLYVDGSIEAELPQGALRFASINELRSHLENNA